MNRPSHLRLVTPSYVPANDNTPAHDITLSLYRIAGRVFSLAAWVLVGLVVGVLI